MGLKFRWTFDARGEYMVWMARRVKHRRYKRRWFSPKARFESARSVRWRTAWLNRRVLHDLFDRYVVVVGPTMVR